jgi:hypothetical protein
MSRTVPIQTKRTKFSGAPPKRRKATQATQVRKIARALGVENKYFDVPVGFNIPATVDWASTEVGADMPQIPLGDDITQRQGRKVLLSRVDFRGTVMSTALTAQNAVPGPNTVRVVLVRNMQPNGVSMNGEDVMGLNGAAAANSSVATHMFQNIVSFGRAKIVDDVMVNLDATVAVNNASATTVSCASVERSIRLTYRPKKPITINYASSSTAVPNTNSFNILVNAEAVQYVPNLQGVIRFYYTDA